MPGMGAMGGMAGGYMGGILGAVGGLLSSREAQRQSKQWNRYAMGAANEMLPRSVMNAAHQYNPFLWSALGEQGLMQNDPTGTGAGGTPYGNTAYSQQLAKIINNPGYIDPKLIDQNMRGIDRGRDTALLKAQGMMGQSGMQGGLGQAYALASQAGKTTDKANLMQQYILFREQTRRSDLAMIDQMMQSSINTASQNQQARANYMIQQRPTVGWRGVAGATVQGFMSGMGMDSGQPPPGQGGESAQGGRSQYVNSLGSQGNWYDKGAAGSGGGTWNGSRTGFLNSGGSSMDFGGGTANPFSTSKPITTPTNAPTVYRNKQPEF